MQYRITFKRNTFFPPNTMDFVVNESLSFGFLFYIICKLPLVTYQIMNVKTTHVCAWYSFVFCNYHCILFHWRAEIHSPPSRYAAVTLSNALVRWKLEQECVSRCSLTGQEHGRAAGRSKPSRTRELRGVVVGWLRHGDGGETEESSSECFVPTNRGSFLQWNDVTRPGSVLKRGVVKSVEHLRPRAAGTTTRRLNTWHVWNVNLFSRWLLSRSRTKPTLVSGRAL